MKRELFYQDFHYFKPPYEIMKPLIDTGETYHFITDSGLLYEVTFGRKKENYLHHLINFSVISEEFEDDEYTVTNKGELYRIIATLIEIIRIFHYYHPHTERYELTGEFKEKNDSREASIRTRLYYRCAKYFINNKWSVVIRKNTVIISRN